MLEHGGRLLAAAARYGIPVSEWLDLSTGIAPHGYPVPAIPPEAWHRLPEDEDGLAAIAGCRYGASRVLPLPGSQAAIQLLPRLRPAGTSLLLGQTYAEYGAAWRAAGHQLRHCAAADLMEAADEADVLVLGNPNNPTGERFTRTALLALAETLRRRNGWLVVDEAFADADDGGPDDNSLCALAGNPGGENIIVLRSLGKFYGLAGARVGFAFAEPTLLASLARQVGPWALAHPARIVASAALADTAWQARQARRLREGSARLDALLVRHGFLGARGCALFRYLTDAAAGGCHEFLAQRGILLRRFESPDALRIGLPATDPQWQRLDEALAAWRKQ